jgi:HPt (histidine-containing phosphotransfer) domain-containing protein
MSFWSVTEYERKMAELQARFRVRLARELEDLRKFTAANVSPHDLSGLQDQVHRLAGLSGSMGHPEISAIAKIVDEALSGGPGEGEVAQLTATLISAIQNVVER